MGETTGISWCDATFNPWIGCTKVSPGCKFCYAERENQFYQWNRAGWGPLADRKKTSQTYWLKPLIWNKQAEKDGVRRKVFCSSLADVFDDHPSILSEWRSELFSLIEQTPWLNWLLLTKRPENINRMVADFAGDCEWLSSGAKNVWLGTTTEDQEQADNRIPLLLQTPTVMHFLSVEPMLGSVILPEFSSYIFPDGFENNGPMSTTIGISYEPDNHIDWVICGGESGPNARPMHPRWARHLRDQCSANNIPFFFKQWGEWVTAGQAYALGYNTRDTKNTVVEDGSFPCIMSKIGKKAAGCLLDGREWKEFPEKNR
jgi:protein gp37